MDTNRCHCCYTFGVNNAQEYFAISEIVPGCTSVPTTPKPPKGYFSFPGRQVPAGINKRKSRKPPTTRFRMPIPSSALYREIPVTGLYDNVPRILKYIDRADHRYTLEREMFQKCLGQKVVLIRLKYFELNYLCDSFELPNFSWTLFSLDFIWYFLTNIYKFLTNIYKFLTNIYNLLANLLFLDTIE